MFGHGRKGSRNFQLDDFDTTGIWGSGTWSIQVSKKNRKGEELKPQKTAARAIRKALWGRKGEGVRPAREKWLLEESMLRTPGRGHLSEGDAGRSDCTSRKGCSERGRPCSSLVLKTRKGGDNQKPVDETPRNLVDSRIEATVGASSSKTDVSGKDQGVQSNP